jgi:hypothetical protein
VKVAIASVAAPDIVPAAEITISLLDCRIPLDENVSLCRRTAGCTSAFHPNPARGASSSPAQLRLRP